MTIYKEGLREAFALYKGLNGTVSSILYRKVIKEYYAKIIESIILNNLEYKFNRMGSILLTKVKPRLTTWDDGSIKPTLPIDWVNTKKYGKLIYHRNNNRYGYTFRIKWVKGKTDNVSIFKFYPERYNFKRRLAKYLLDEDIKIDAPIVSDAYYNTRA